MTTLQGGEVWTVCNHAAELPYINMIGTIHAILSSVHNLMTQPQRHTEVCMPVWPGQCLYIDCLTQLYTLNLPIGCVLFTLHCVSVLQYHIANVILTSTPLWIWMVGLSSLICGLSPSFTNTHTEYFSLPCMVSRSHLYQSCNYTTHFRTRYIESVKLPQMITSITYATLHINIQLNVHVLLSVTYSTTHIIYI
jgi:hypothetical protein